MSHEDQVLAELKARIHPMTESGVASSDALRTVTKLVREAMTGAGTSEDRLARVGEALDAIDRHNSELSNSVAANVPLYANSEQYAEAVAKHHADAQPPLQEGPAGERVASNAALDDQLAGGFKQEKQVAAGKAQPVDAAADEADDEPVHKRTTSHKK